MGRGEAITAKSAASCPNVNINQDKPHGPAEGHTTGPNSAQSTCQGTCRTVPSMQHAAVDGAGGGREVAPLLHSFTPSILSFLTPWKCSRASEKELGALLSPPNQPQPRAVGGMSHREAAAPGTMLLSCLILFP